MGRRFALLLIALVASILVSCGRVDPPENSGELVIGIVAGETTYQNDAGVISGFEYDLLEKFAGSSNLKTRYLLLKDQGALLDALHANRIHVAVGIAVDVDAGLLYSAPVLESNQVIVGHADDLSIEEQPLELSGRTIETLLDSPQTATLLTLAKTSPGITVVEVAGSSSRDLLQRVAEAKSHLAATDALNYSLALKSFPDLTVVEELPGKIRTGWAFLPKNQMLLQSANRYIDATRKDGSLARLQDRYFGHIQRIKAEGIARFIHDIQIQLPRYRMQFQAAQVASGIDWRMIAALAYQESKWDPLATSFTNVRGMMMLTEDTADRMGVDNRLDSAQSIRAGARYLAALLEELPEEIMEPDRTWMALAAYNLGMGHMNGARTFARQMKKDSTSWYDMKKVLPLMSQPEYYVRLKAGPARGGEAVIMVENIRNYFDILSRIEPAWQPTPKLSLGTR